MFAYYTGLIEELGQAGVQFASATLPAASTLAPKAAARQSARATLPGTGTLTADVGALGRQYGQATLAASSALSPPTVSARVAGGAVLAGGASIPYGSQAATGIDNTGGLPYLTATTGYPTSDPGTPGSVWNNGLAIAVSPGITPNPAAPPVYYGISAGELLALGGGNLPLAPTSETKQLWNNGGLISLGGPIPLGTTTSVRTQARGAFQATSFIATAAGSNVVTATLSGTSGWTATARVRAGPRATLGATSSFTIGGGTQQNAGPRAYLGAEARLTANARVLSSRTVLAGVPAGLEPAIIALELQTYVPGQAAVPATKSHGTRAHGTLSRAGIATPELTELITASDVGYRTRSTDPGGVVSYPPLLADAFQIDARLTLQPETTAAGAAWGSVLLANPNGQFDPLIGVQNSDGRPIRLLTGRKTFDSSRQYFTDPAYASLSVLFSGLATPWALGDNGLQVPLRDATYWLEKPLQANLYGGTGGVEGTSDLTGKPKPKTRGGTSGNPILNVTPTLIDATNRIYQWNDAPGTIVALYEGGAPVITYQGDVGDLYSGSTSAGQYRTNNANGLFQLGSVPVAEITIDCTGSFPIAGLQYNPYWIAQYMLQEDCAMPPELIAWADFAAIAFAHNYGSGVYFGSDQVWTAVQGLEAILMGLGANLVPLRNGTLSVAIVEAIGSTEPIVASFDTTKIIACNRRPLPSVLDPPPFRIRCGYNHNYTVQTNGLNTASSTAAHRQFIGAADRFASWADANLVAAYRRPNDYTAFPTALLSQSNAQAVANNHGAMWGVPRRLYDITLPASQFGIDLGKVVSITYPIERLASGQKARVVGYSYRSADATVIYTVIV